MTLRGNEEFLSGRLLLSRLCCFNGKKFKKVPLVVEVNECVCHHFCVSYMGGSQGVNVGDLHSASSLFPLSPR